MENIKAHIRNHFFFYILAPLIIISAFFSYNRFMVRQDYLVSYEGVCDPSIEKCFVGCEDDSCATNYYYSKVIKYAPDVYKECGPDIADCEAANSCLPEDHNCSVTFCNPAIDGEICSTPPSEMDTPKDEQTSPVKNENSLQEDNTNNANI